jgi:AcrR family transcriptional regulator
MPAASDRQLSNRRRRTRKDLLQAAARLVQQGRKPSLEDVAQAALVSRATAYRYFPNIASLLNEAALDVAAPDPDIVFSGDASDDPAERLIRAEVAMHAMLVKNEVSIRMMLAHAVTQRARHTGARDLPVRQNRRARLIQTALAPAKKQFRPAAFDKLVKALALFIGTEELIVFRDVLNVDDAEAARVKHWAIRALVDAARRQTPKQDR